MPERIEDEDGGGSAQDGQVLHGQLIFLPGAARVSVDIVFDLSCESLSVCVCVCVCVRSHAYTRAHTVCLTVGPRDADWRS